VSAGALETTGDVVIMGLIPALSSSTAPRGIPPPNTEPVAPAPNGEVGDKPDAVPADVPAPQDAAPEPIGFVLMPLPSKVDAEPVVPWPV
jgi:hypothetical protein